MSFFQNDAVPGGGSLTVNVLAGATGWVAALATELNYGLIAFAPLLLSGGDHTWHGVAAALLAAVLANCGASLAGGRPAVTSGGRPMLSIVLASYVGALMALPGLAGNDGALLACASLCVMLSGAFKAGFGLLKLGRIIKYVPYPVFSGFALAAALTLLSSAWKPLLGHLLAPSAAMAGVTGGANPVQLGTVLVGLATVVIGLNSWRWLPRVPSIVVAFLGGSVLDGLARLIFGDVFGPTLPRFDAIAIQAPLLSAASIWAQLPGTTVVEVARLTLTTAFSLAMLASLETLVVNSSLDQLLTAKVSGDAQLFSFGIGNVASGLVAGLPCAPSISRAVLVCRNGGRTHAVQATYILLSAAIIAFPQPLGLVPQSVLGASMILVAVGLIDDGMLRTLRQALIERGALSPAVRRQATENALVLVSVAVVGTLLGLIQAVIIGTVISTILFLQHNRREVVRRLFRCNVHRSRRIRDHEGSQVLNAQGHRIAVVEAQGPLYFATADRLYSQIESLAAECHWLILDCRRVTHIDTTGVHLLAQLVRYLERKGVVLCLSYVSPTSEVGETLRNLGLDHVLPLDRWHMDTDHALESCESDLIRQNSPARQGVASLPLLATDLCRDLTDASAESLLRSHMHRHAVSAGELLFRRGDPGDSLYVVTAGDLTLQIQTGNAAQAWLRLATYTPGVVFGEMAFLQGGQRSADARAETDVEVFELRRQDLVLLERAAPHLASQLLINIGRVLADRLRNCTQELAESEAV